MNLRRIRSRGLCGPAVTLQIELLERRLFLHCGMSFYDGILKVRGDRDPNEIVIYDDGLGSLEVQCDGDTQFVDGVSRVVVRAKGGSDIVDYILEEDLEVPMRVRIDLGRGSDESILDVSDEGRLSLLADLKMTVYGRAGGDLVEASFGTVEDAEVDFRARLGNQNDVFQGYLDGDLLGSADLSVDVTGGNRHDLLEFFGEGSPEFGDVFLDLRSSFDLFLEGESGKDELVGLLHLSSDSAGTLAVMIDGDRGHDLLSLIVLDELGDAFDPDLVLAFDGEVNGGRGSDTCDVTSNVAVFQCVELFIGSSETDFLW